MGVSGLWQLLDKIKVDVDPRSLKDLRLAVDVSIWLHQAGKSVRSRNSHIQLTFIRICKLLHYGVRPIFVFDGQVPFLKRRTMSARRKGRQECLQRKRCLENTAKQAKLLMGAIEGDLDLESDEDEVFKVPEGKRFQCSNDVDDASWENVDLGICDDDHTISQLSQISHEEFSAFQLERFKSDSQTEVSSSSCSAIETSVKHSIGPNREVHLEVSDRSDEVHSSNIKSSRVPKLICKSDDRSMNDESVDETSKANLLSALIFDLASTCEDKPKMPVDQTRSEPFKQESSGNLNVDPSLPTVSIEDAKSKPKPTMSLGDIIDKETVFISSIEPEVQPLKSIMDEGESTQHNENTMIEAKSRLHESIDRLKEEARVLKTEGASITDEIVQDIKYLLDLFDIPIVQSPAEAEAECAYLEVLGSVDGIITDDSDAFLFGAKRVYRNFFKSTRNGLASSYDSTKH
ncbi:hypothetical protein ACOME3_004974 [Neoechinorhynchus agilis]